MATNKIQTGIRFEPELLYKITHIAKKNKRSLNAQLEFLAQNCVEEYEDKNGEIPLDEDAWGLMTENGGGKYTVRFRILEWLESLFA